MIGATIGHGGVGAPLFNLTSPDPLIVTIQGLDIDLADATLQIDQTLGSRSTCNFEFEDRTNAIFLAGGERVIVTYRDRRVFCGAVIEWENVAVGAQIDDSRKRVSVQCADHNEYADRRHVAKIYEGMTADAIVRDIHDLYLEEYGVTIGDVQVSTIVHSRVRFNYDLVSQCLSDLADSIGWEWRIDEYKRLNFYDRSTRFAPFDINDIDDPRKYLPGLLCRQTMERYRNRQILRAGKDLLAPRTEDQKGDGKKQSFNDISFVIGETPTVSVDLNGAGFNGKTVGVIGIDDQDDAAGFEWFWKKGEKTLSQNTTGTELTTLDTLRVTYKGLATVILISQNAPAVTAQKAREGGSGVYEGIEEDKRIESAEHASTIVAGILRKHARIPCIVEGETDEAGLMAGQLINFQLAAEKIVGSFLIDRASMSAFGRDNIRTSFTAIDGESLGGWPEFFRQLARDGRDFSIDDDESLNLSTAESSQLDHTDALTSTSSDVLATYKNDRTTFFFIGGTATGQGARIGASYNVDGEVDIFGRLTGDRLNVGAKIGPLVSP